METEIENGLHATNQSLHNHAVMAVFLAGEIECFALPAKLTGRFSAYDQGCSCLLGASATFGDKANRNTSFLPRKNTDAYVDIKELRCAV